jgi:hypothetical protein
MLIARLALSRQCLAPDDHFTKVLRERRPRGFGQELPVAVGCGARLFKSQLVVNIRLRLDHQGLSIILWSRAAAAVGMIKAASSIGRPNRGA